MDPPESSLRFVVRKGVNDALADNGMNARVPRTFECGMNVRAQL
jgi:hypothetical protein